MMYIWILLWLFIGFCSSARMCLDDHGCIMVKDLPYIAFFSLFGFVVLILWFLLWIWDLFDENKDVILYQRRK
jgi:hypothetical protein